MMAHLITSVLFLCKYLQFRDILCLQRCQGEVTAMSSFNVPIQRSMMHRSCLWVSECDLGVNIRTLGSSDHVDGVNIWIAMTGRRQEGQLRTFNLQLLPRDKVQMFDAIANSVPATFQLSMLSKFSALYSLEISSPSSLTEKNRCIDMSSASLTISSTSSLRGKVSWQCVR